MNQKGEPMETDGHSYSFRNLLLYFLKLGTIGFGGPIALVGRMQSDLVEHRAWLGKEEYLRGLALAQLAPGPLAAQLAMYIGYVKNGFIGTTLVGIAFILPSFAMVVLLGWLYVAYGGLDWMQALFYGISAAVIGIIVRSAFKLMTLTLKNDPLLWGIFLAMCVVTAVTQREIAWLFLLSGLAAMVIRYPPKAARLRMHAFGVPSAAAIGALAASAPPPMILSIFLFFAKAGAFVFGSGLAIVPFLYGSTVEQYHWLTQRQFLDAVAVAMITPGPVVITVGFIGFLVAGLPGAVAAAFGVFLPVYFVVLVLSPFYERIAANPRVHAFVQGVTASASGAIAGAVIVLGRRAIVDIPTALIGLVTLLVIYRFKLPEPVVVIAAGLCGLLVYHAVP